MEKIELTKEELSTIYKVLLNSKDKLFFGKKEVFNDYYGEYEEPFSKKIFESILKKISKELPKEDADDINKESLRRKYHTYNNDVDEKIYSTLQKAFAERKSVDISYFNMESADFSNRELDVYYTSAKYTIGYCHLKKAIRKFRTSRISKAKINSGVYSIPEGFNKNNY